MSSRRLQYVFKTSSRSPQDILQASCKNVIKTSSRGPEDIGRKSFKKVFKTSLRRFEDNFKVSSRLLTNISISLRRF